MSAITSPAILLLALPPLATEHWVILSFLFIAAIGGMWFWQGKKIEALVQQQADQATAHAVVMKAHAEAAAAQNAAAQHKLDEAAAAHQALNERYDILSVASEQRIASLSTDLTATREIAAQLEPTKVRVSDLETALASERGRIGALEQTIEVSNKRVEDFEKRAVQAQQELVQNRDASAKCEREQQSVITRLEQTIKSNEALVATADTQVTQANETLTSYRQQAEARITNLQRQLTAAEARSAMVQKEFMSAVGALPDAPSPAARSSAAPATTDDKRTAELEAKITQIEAESRKKAREDGYKIAELEFRLSEAQDALAAAKPVVADKADEGRAAGPPAAVEAPATVAAVPDEPAVEPVAPEEPNSPPSQATLSL